MLKRKYVIGNWKMNPQTETEAVLLATAVKEGLQDFDFSKVAVVVCPSFVHIPAVKHSLVNSGIAIGSQDVYFEAKGAYTGAVSFEQLKEFVSFAIIGHSERRQYFGETDESINKKLKSVLQAGIVPVLCVGEDFSVREENWQIDYVREQISKDLQDLFPDDVGKIIIAYEPVWAIGTGMAATSEQVKEMIDAVRHEIERKFGVNAGSGISVLYGGSTNGENVDELIKNSGCDGFLVGGASLKPEHFIKICQSVQV